MATDRPNPPSHLSRASRAWWRRVVDQYALEEHEQRLLEAALTAWDRAQQARVLLQDDGLVTTDRYGKPKTHPAVAIERDARADFARLLRQLDLTGEPDPSYRRRRAI